MILCVIHTRILFRWALSFSPLKTLCEFLKSKEDLGGDKATAKLGIQKVGANSNDQILNIQINVEELT